MEKRVLLGVQKRKPIKRCKKKLLKKLVDYLKSDSYMFAPLLSSPSSGSRPPKINRSSATRLEVKEPSKENKNKGLLWKIGEYLKSDSYMYASLVVPPQSVSPPTGPSWYTKRVTMEVSTKKVNMLDNQPTDQSANVVGGDQTSNSFLHETSISEERTLVHREMVKHMVYQNCRTTSVSGKGVLKPRLRKIVVD